MEYPRENETSEIRDERIDPRADPWRDIIGFVKEIVLIHIIDKQHVHKVNDQRGIRKLTQEFLPYFTELMIPEHRDDEIEQRSILEENEDAEFLGR